MKPGYKICYKIILLLITSVILTACSKSKADNNDAVVNTIENDKAPANELNEDPSSDKLNHNTSDTATDTPAINEPAAWVDEEIESLNKMVAIDPGHQQKGNYEEEPIGSGAKETKPKTSSGTKGVSTGIYEYELNLTIAKMVKEELENRGYDTNMIRETNDVNLSNKERADMANDSEADIFIRIHADSISDSDIRGISTLYPSSENPYVAYLSENSLALSKSILEAMCDNTKAKNRGTIPRDDMSGINWCTIPVSIIEMGFMSNPKEDELMQTRDYQNKIVTGICDGIDTYFNNIDFDKTP